MPNPDPNPSADLKAIFDFVQDVQQLAESCPPGRLRDKGNALLERAKAKAKQMQQVATPPSTSEFCLAPEHRHQHENLDGIRELVRSRMQK